MTPEDLVSFTRLNEFSVNKSESMILVCLSKLNEEMKHSPVLEVREFPSLSLLREFPCGVSPEWIDDASFHFLLSGRIHRASARDPSAASVVNVGASGDVCHFRFHPGRGRFLFTQRVQLDAPAAAAVAAAPGHAMEFDELMVRQWRSWRVPGEFEHLFVTSPSGARDLMPGWRADCPLAPFGGREGFSFARDGDEALFVAKTARGSATAWSTSSRIWRSPLDAVAPAEAVSAGEGAEDRPIPHADRVFYLSMARPGFESDKNRVLMRDAEGRERDWTAAVDLTCGDFALEVAEGEGKNGNSGGVEAVWWTAPRRGHTALMRVDAEGRNEVLVAEGHVGAFQRLAGGDVVFVWDAIDAPARLRRWTPAAAAPQDVWDPNAERLPPPSKPEQFAFRGADGDEVCGFFVRCPAAAGKEGVAEKRPLVVLVHGGPEGTFSNHFHYRWNPAVFASQGWHVIVVDFHGSVGYGQAFTDSIQNDWGGKPLVDVLKAVEYVCDTFAAEVDARRVAACGASYGGYMMNWIAGQAPERFRCLVNHSGIFDQVMSYYDTEELWFPEFEFKCTPWEDEEPYRRHNPSAHVARWKAPMLLLHGQLDFRIPYTHSLCAFTACQRQGIPSRLVMFPDECHWVTDPSNSLRWHSNVFDWIKKYI